MNSPNTIAWVKYWNMYPLKYEFEKITKKSFNIIEDHPKTINELVRKNKVSSGPCSSICLNHYPNMKNISPHGVCAADHVYSVIAVIQGQEEGIYQHIKKRNLVAKKILEKHNLQNFNERTSAWKELAQYSISNPYKNPPKLVLSADSETSVQLIKILSFLWFGKININEHDQDAWSLKLVIGDKALTHFFSKKRQSNSHTLDLGHQWYELTALPFVYAIWQSTKSKDPRLTEALNEAAIKAELNMRENPDIYFKKLQITEQQAIQLIPYWKKIYYRISTREETSLNLFLDFARFLAQPSSMTNQMSRWQSKKNHLSLRD